MWGKSDAHQLCKVTFQFAHGHVWFSHTHTSNSVHTHSSTMWAPQDHKKHWRLLITQNTFRWWHKQIASQWVVILISKEDMSSFQCTGSKSVGILFPLCVISCIYNYWLPNFLFLSLFCQKDNASYEDFLKPVLYPIGTWRWCPYLVTWSYASFTKHKTLPQINNTNECSYENWHRKTSCVVCKYPSEVGYI